MLHNEESFPENLSERVKIHNRKIKKPNQQMVSWLNQLNADLEIWLVYVSLLNN